MIRSRIIDAALGLVAVGLSVATAVISAHVSPAYRAYLYALAAAWAVVAVAQAVRSVTASRRHDREVAELRAGQEWLAQPESYRQFDMLFKHNDALQAADRRFTNSFEIDSQDAQATTVRCKACGWRATEALLYARDSALKHLDAFHPPPEVRQGLLARLRS
jgi:hypothetical protein